MDQSAYRMEFYNQLIIFEFFLPLAHEPLLRSALDALFYRDSILERLQRTEPEVLRPFFPPLERESQEEYRQRLGGWIAERFTGYSIQRVDGKFRAASLRSYCEVSAMLKAGQQYLCDETTAVVRFIFPCGAPQGLTVRWDEPMIESWAGDRPTEPVDAEAAQIRVLFYILFVQRIVEVIADEAEIWLLESGMRQRLTVWKKADPPEAELRLKRSPEI